MLGLTLGLLAWFGLDWVFELLGISPEQTEFARDYQRVLLPATPLFLAAATLKSSTPLPAAPKPDLLLPRRAASPTWSLTFSSWDL